MVRIATATSSLRGIEERTQWSSNNQRQDEELLHGLEGVNALHVNANPIKHVPRLPASQSYFGIVTWKPWGIDCFRLVECYGEKSVMHYRHSIRIYRDSAMSSIRSNILTVSAANSTALVLTSNGCSTFSSAMLFLTPPLRMLTPAFCSPNPCRCLRSVTTLMLFSPAFSASVVGITSIASAKAFQHIASVPVRLLDWCASDWAMAISGAPPPAINAFFLTRHRITQSASWRLRSTSSRISELAPLHMMETVCPAPLCVTPVTFTTREAENWTSSISSAEPSLSSENELMSAIGLQPVLCDSM